MRCVISLTHVVYDGGKTAALMRDEVLLWAYWQNQDTYAYLHVMRRWEVTSSVNVYRILWCLGQKFRRLGLMNLCREAGYL